MARTNAALFAFNRGEVAKAALSRIDNERLRLAAECQLNWLPTVLGEMTLRPGLQQINEIYQDAAGQTIPFVFSKTDSAILELTPDIMRVEIQGVLVSRVAVGTVVADPFFAGGGSWGTGGTTAGAAVTIGSGQAAFTATAAGSLAQISQTLTVGGADFGKEHALRIVVANGPVTLRAGSSAGLADMITQTVIDTGTHSLVFKPNQTNVVLQIESHDAWQKTLTQCSIEAAGVLALPTPWGSTQLPTLRWDQSGDIVYVAAVGLQTYKIERRAAHAWSVALYRPALGPFSTISDGTVGISCSAQLGNGTLTATAPLFVPGCEQQLIQMFMTGQQYINTLAGNSTFTPAVRVSGVGATRNYTWTIAGTWSSSLNFERSYDGPDTGFVVVSGIPSDGTYNSITGGTGGTPDLDNVIAWERIGFVPGAYASGVATLTSGYTGGGAFGLVRILSYISPTQVSVEILSQLSSTNVTTDFMMSDWSDALGWPTSVAFFEGRLGWASGLELALSESDNYTGFGESDLLGNDLGAAGAIIEIFGSGPVDRVNWLLPLTRLLCGREQSIESVRSSSFDEVVTAANVSTKPCATRGAARAKAVRLDTSGIFIDESGTRVYKLSFTPQRLDYAAEELTRLNTDIGEPGFTDIAVQRQRDTHIWLPKNDGQCAVLMEEEADEISCWWRLQTLGVVENVCVIPAPSGPENQVFLTVKRVINGVTRRFREKLAPRLNCIGGSINQLFDCHFVYQGAAVSTVQVTWLPNTVVGVWADGSYLGTATADGSGNVAMPDGQTHSNIVVGILGEAYVAEAVPASYTPVSSVAVPAAYNGFPAEVFADDRRIGVLTVTGGAITLPMGRTASVITAFVGYMAPFMSAKLAYAADGGTAINQRKSIDHVGLLLLNTSAQGLQMGQRFDDLDPMPLIEGGALVPAGTVWDQYDKDPIEVEGEWNTDARLCLLGAAPYPVSVNAVVVSMTTNG